MQMVRQPTIKSLFFLMTLVAIVSAAIGKFEGSFDEPANAIVWGALVGYLTAPLMLALWLERLSIVMGLTLVICSLTAIWMFIWTTTQPQDVISGSLFWASCGFVLPLNAIFQHFSHQTDAVLWLLVPYCALYVALGPAFAMTCRLRSPQGK